jgi:hypothetical protein
MAASAFVTADIFFVTGGIFNPAADWYSPKQLPSHGRKKR